MRQISGSRLLAAFGLLAAATAGSSSDSKAPPSLPSPLSPQEALKHFRLDAGLRIELVACEPQIESPVAMAFDEDGRLWVVEMRDYPNGPPPGKPPEGRIKVLEDKDGDGRYETSRAFADHLLFANGLMPWKGGLLVTAAPHIALLSDTDGDGKADRREVLYEGFATQNPQLRVSHPNLGLDNWVYVANGLRGGKVKRSGRPDATPVSLSGMDFRFDLVHDRYEAVSGLGQYGNTFDDWGRRFVCDNRHHLRHVVLPSRYIRRNPFLAVPDVVQDVSVLDLTPGPLSSGGRIYPISRNWTTSSLHVGHFTAACGVCVYRGDLLPETYRGAAFTCDPTGNLVHMEALTPHGGSFTSRPAKDGVEFLASPDEWFRPVFLTNGPDGAFYVVDMYRAVIEHPEFMPPELKNRPDLTLGKERGRIWRIVPEKHAAKPVRPHLSKASTEELVVLLAHPNAWWRTTAQRLLLERQDRGAGPALRRLCETSNEPLARLHAAWMLHGLGALDRDLVVRLLRDPHPRVREHAVHLSEGWLAGSEAVQERVTALAGDPDGGVRFQVALSLGEWDDDRVLTPLARVALAEADDRWRRAAVASAVPRRAGALLKLVLHPPTELVKQPLPDRAALARELAALVGARQDGDEVAMALDAALALDAPGDLPLKMGVLNGLAEGMGRRGAQLGRFLAALPAARRSVAERADVFLKQAAHLAAEPRRDPAERVAAVRLLAHASWPVAQPTLARLLNEEPSQDVRLAAVRALAAHAEAKVPALLTQSWKSQSPAVRREVTEALFGRPERLQFLLSEMEAGRIQPGDLDPARAQQLLKHRDATIRERARKLLAAGSPAERQQVLDRYRGALSLKADPHRGREVFRKNCATCHRVADVGVDVGPDIADTRTKTAEALLVDVLNPNQAIDNNYVNYVVTTKGGKVLSGILAAETASSVTLRRAENQTDVVLRQDIEEIQSTGTSLMPEGLEKNINLQEMADLLSFLKNWRYLDGSVPPEVIKP
jgi:putative membrane-bound dehydrogenase-like protein